MLRNAKNEYYVMLKTLKCLLLYLSIIVSALFTVTHTAKAGPLSELILFTCKPYKYFQIYSVRPDGRDLQQVLDIRRNCREPNLCAETNEIVFSMFSDNTWNLYITDTNGSFVRRLTSTAYADRHPVWTPDGSQIIFSTTRWGHTELATVNADGSNLQRLTHNGLMNDYPVLSPDGKKLAFMSWKRGLSHIYIMNLLSGSVRPVLKKYEACVTPTWSPDSQSLAFRGRSYFGDLLACVSKNDGLRQFRENTKQASYPAWSPTGDKIIFSDNYKQSHTLKLLNPQTGEIEPFATEIPAQAYDLVWQKKNRTW